MISLPWASCLEYIQGPVVLHLVYKDGVGKLRQFVSVPVKQEKVLR